MTAKWRSNPRHLQSDSARSSQEPDRETDLTLSAPDLTISQLSFAAPAVRWRERHHFHFFINFTAPQLAGIYGNEFWQGMVIRAAYHEHAILHALIGIGSLHEGILQNATFADLERSKSYTFALSTLNKAISLLRSSDNHHPGPPDMRRILTFCILLTTFEALQGRTSEAIQHSLQGTRLLEGRRDSLANESPKGTLADKPYPVAQSAITSQLAYFAYVAAVYLASPGEVLLDAHVTLQECFFSIEEAERPLQDAKNAITMLVIRAFRGKSAEARDDAEREMRTYKPWLERWKNAFDGFVSRDRYRFTDLETKQVLILEANYLYCLATTMFDNDVTDPRPYRHLNGMLEKMVDVAEEAVSIPSAPSPTLAAANGPYLSYGMWFSEPLYVAMSHATDKALRKRAALIFAQHPRPECISHVGPYAPGDVMLKPGIQSKLQTELVLDREASLSSSPPSDTAGCENDQYLEFSEVSEEATTMRRSSKPR